MLWANGSNNHRVEPEPGARGSCPSCGGMTIAKCGEIKIWHWAHEAGADCDSWAEGMTEWHRDWQECWPEHQRELVIDGEHRADVVTAFSSRAPALGNSHSARLMAAGVPTVMEFQHSHLSTEGIAERESFYGKFPGQMIWVWDCRDVCDKRLLTTWQQKPGSGSHTLQWKWFHETLAACTFPVYLDTGGDTLLLVVQWPEWEWISGEYREWHTGFRNQDGSPEVTGSSGGRHGWGTGTCIPVSKKDFIQSLQISLAPRTPGE